MPTFAALQDVYDLGFTARAFVVVPRAWNADNGRSGDTIDLGTGVIRTAGHGYTASDLLEFVLVASGGALPGGAPSGVLLSPNPIDFFRFTLSMTPGGSPLAYSSAGSGWGLQIDPERRLQRHLDDFATRIERALIAQAHPIVVDPNTGKYPPELVGINARGAARSAIPSLQFESPAFRAAADRVLAAEAADERMLAEWLAGKPLVPEVQNNDGAQDAGAASSAITRGKVYDMPWLTGQL